MNLSETLKLLPDTKGVVVILSGGMDSTISMRLCVEKYGKDNVSALTFDYGQKQAIEIERAKESTYILGVKHKIIDALHSRCSFIEFKFNKADNPSAIHILYRCIKIVQPVI